MAHRTPSSAGGERDFARLAQDAAEACTPEFSSARHQRIMQAVSSAGPGNLSIDLSARSFRPAVFIPLGLAAMIAMVVAGPAVSRLLHPTQQIVTLPPNHPQANVPIEPAVDVPVPAIDQAAHQVNVRVQDAVQTAMVQQQWVGLDHDVKLAARYLVDQAPIRSAIDLGGDEQRQ